MTRNKKITKKEFDKIIKQNLIESGVSKDCFTYKIQEGQKIREYGEYYQKSEFEKFVNEMKKEYPNHYKKFKGNEDAKENKGGAGGELDEKRGRYGLVPPKMASVASSSRFCYLALRDGTNSLLPGKTLTKDDIEFEKECRIFDSGSTAPQLDAYIPDEECDIFIEAKCHEIFDSHKAILKNKYWGIFKDNKILCKALLGITQGNDNFELPLRVFGFDHEITHTRFDIKQFICHLLGIAKQNRGRKSKLVYLFFKPTVDDIEISQHISDIFAELRDEVETIFNCDLISNFCVENNIELEAVVEESYVMEKISSLNARNIQMERFS